MSEEDRPGQRTHLVKKLWLQGEFPKKWDPPASLRNGGTTTLAHIPDPELPRSKSAPWIGAALGFYGPIFRNRWNGQPIYYSMLSFSSPDRMTLFVCFVCFVCFNITIHRRRLGSCGSYHWRFSTPLDDPSTRCHGGEASSPVARSANRRPQTYIRLRNQVKAFLHSDISTALPAFVRRKTTKLHSPSKPRR